MSADDRQRWRAIALGVVLGAPVVAVFATLFASADVSFDAYLDELTTTLSFGSLIERGFLILVIALAAAGVWRTARRPEDRLPETLPDWPGPRIDPRSAITVLTLLVGLFALFVLTQVLGHNPDLVTPQDYSQNARNGFFQLLTVTFLVLTLLLVLDWLTRRPDGGRHRGVDRLALALVALTGVVVVSALSRMRLYVNEFGFTELRIYTTVFMVWLGFVLVWFLITVLRNRHARFAFGVLTSALVVVFGLNVANPDSLIVQFNWDRHVAGAEFAQEYSSTLSADSIPALIQIVEDHPDEQFCFVERRLERERAALAAKRAAHGLLGDSWSQYRARGALSSFDVRSGDGC